MGPPLFLAIDQGTHASRALVIDASGAILAHGEREIGLVRPQPDWAEQDGDEVVASVLDAAAQAVAKLGERRRELVAAGIASQRASAVCWDRSTGKPLSPIFSWQDRRAHAWIAELAAHGDDVHRRTGLFLSPHYGATKLRWALDHLPAVRAARDAGTLCWGPMASFLAFRLCRERPLLADPQCAARTQLWNLQSRDWDPDLLALFGLPAGFLPESVPTVHAWGAMEIGDTSVELRAVNGDQSAAVFAFGRPEADAAYVNIGTSAFVQRALDASPGHVPRQLTGIIYADGRETTWMVEGNVNGAGTAIEWMANAFEEDDIVGALARWLQEPGEPPLFLNGIAGLGGPFWQATFDTRFVGEGSTALKARAVIESIAFLLQANVDHMAPYVPAPKRMRVSGGLSKIDALCRHLATLSGLPVLRRDDPEASARGIAFIAAGRPATWTAGNHDAEFAPVPDAALSARYRRWRALMKDATGV
jgi:glycerol kinase